MEILVIFIDLSDLLLQPYKTDSDSKNMQTSDVRYHKTLHQSYIN